MKPLENFKLKGTKLSAGTGEAQGSTGKDLNCVDPGSSEDAS